MHVDAHVFVRLDRIAPAALHEAAIEEHTGMARSKQVLGPGDSLCGADELDLHAPHGISSGAAGC
jgi:hypothetical protein